jgi:isoleucyl-tRNA synthetase
MLLSHTPLLHSSHTLLSHTPLIHTPLLHSSHTLLPPSLLSHRLYTVVPRLVSFLEDLTNWYVRLNRTRLKGADTTTEDCTVALSCLYCVLLSMAQLMAPFTPFFTEWMYVRLRKIHTNYNAGEEVRIGGAS